MSPRVRTVLAVLAGFVVASAVTATGIANNLGIPPPTWFWIASMAVLLPMAWLGAHVGGRR